MSKPSKMSEDELLALTDLEIRNAVGFYGGKLAEQRRTATYYYLAEPMEDLAPPEIDGRSKVIDPFVRNTIEAMLPQLMVKFTGGDSVVEFEASKPGDEEKAQQCTDYLNYQFWKKNRGHVIAETWMRDALLYKNGILKVWWDTRTEETKEEYKGLSQAELAEIMDDEEVEVTEQKSYPDEEDAEQRKQALEQIQQQLAQMQQPVPPPQNPQQAQQYQQAMQQKQQQAQQLAAHAQSIQSAPVVLLYDVTCKRSKKGGKLAIENVPPEEFLISRKAKDIRNASFVGHRTLRSLSDLRSMGYPASKLDNITSDDGATSLNAEKMERSTWDDEQAYLNFDNPVGDESQHMIWVTECYIRCDWDGDGISELRKVTRAGNVLLDNEETDVTPFVDLVCIRRPHRFFGLSIHDLGKETQLTKTSILRSRLDNEYLETNGRYFAVENQVNLDDLLTSRPGGVVRIKTAGAVGRLDQGMGNGAASMQLLEYMEGFGESATGWTRNTQGNQGSPLMQGTATAANIVANRDDMRVDLIARNFAEGFTELFKQMLKLVCQHQDSKTEIRLGGQWVGIDPREWRNQFDVSINVGLGTGGKDQQVQHLMAVIQQQEKTFPIGVTTPENIYNASEDLAKLIGQKNGDRYFTDPAKSSPQPPKPDPEMIKGQVQTQIAQTNAQITLQVESAKLQAQMQMAQQKAHLDAQVAQATQAAQAQQETQEQQIQAQIETHKANLNAQLENAKVQHERELEMLRIQAENDRAKLEAETKVLVAQITAHTSMQTAQMSAASAEGAKPAEPDNSTGDAVAVALQGFTAALGQIARPRQIVRGPDGRATGIV